MAHCPVAGRRLGAVALALLVARAGVAHAQATRDPTASALDAFGEVSGTERIGLYNGSQIRGFNPQNSGAFRIDGMYFARAGGIANGASNSSSVRVGVNAARLTYPSASGIVDEHLKTYQPGDRELDLSFNVQGWLSPTLTVDFERATKDGRAGVSGGFELLPSPLAPDGSRTHEYYVGIVPEWRPSPGVKLRALISYGHAEYDRGFWGKVAVGPSLPPTESTHVLLPPARKDAGEYASNLGLIGEAPLGGGWKVAASAFASADAAHYDFTSFRYGSTAVAHATLVGIPEQTVRANSFEGRLSKDFRLGPADHRLIAAVRYRWRDSINSDAASADLGPVDAARPVYPVVPRFIDDGARTHDVVRQAVASFDYAGVYGGRLELRAGVDVTRHEEAFRTPAGPVSQSRQTFDFPHISAIYAVNDRWSAFGSYVKGLEDSGVAPTFAVNANQVLPPVLAEQTELGLSHALTHQLSLIMALFEVQKATAGLRDDGVFAIVGEERHRGLEVSVSGQVTPLTRIVVGAVAMDQTLSRLSGARGVSGGHPVGTSPTVVSANVVQTLPFARNWSVDAQLHWSDSKYVNTANTLRAPPITLLNVGVRGKLAGGPMPATLRVVATNVLNVRAWDVATSGAIVPVDRPTIWGTLTLSFGGG